MSSLSSLNKKDFGDDFIWGIASSAFQTEGANDLDGKGISIWDDFTNRKKIIKKDHASHGVNFYSKYREDLALMRSMNITNFRFSISWSRIFPNGTGKINQMGIDYYDRIIDQCLELGITPWLTLYHWDLPMELEKKGGWTNRDIVYWFYDYANEVTKKYGDRVKKWMILNEPMVFTGAGYFLGVHAPGKRGLDNFLKAVHHAVLVQGFTPKLIRNNVSNAEVGSTFSCSHLEPYSNSKADSLATKRADLLLNRLFLEQALGYPYPIDELKTLRKIQDYIGADDEKYFMADLDFVGVQNYTREIIKNAWYIPYLRAKIVPAKKRNVPHTLMNWEIHPPSIYNILKKFGKYPGIKKIYITENGAAFNDQLINGRVADQDRILFLQNYLEQVLKAKNEGINVKGYFAWTFTDNLEWAEGYHPRFGLVHVDFKTQKRTIKDSGLWYKNFLQKTD